MSRTTRTSSRPRTRKTKTQQGRPIKLWHLGLISALYIITALILRFLVS